MPPTQLTADGNADCARFLRFCTPNIYGAVFSAVMLYNGDVNHKNANETRKYYDAASDA